MAYDTVQLDQRVHAALDGLKPSERGQVLTEIFNLIHFSPKDPARFRARQIRPADPEFILETQGLWAVFRTEDSGRVVRVLDLVRPEALAGLTPNPSLSS